MGRGKIAIVGAGAVGCYYGAELALAGESVTLIGRPALVEAVSERGLLLEKGGETRRAQVQASLSPEAVTGAGIVIISVKSGDNDTAARDIAPHLSPDAVVLSFQNGVGNADRLAAALGRPVVSVVVYVAVGMAAPGQVRHHGRGDLVFSQGPDSAAVAERFIAAGIPVQVSDAAETALWTKLVVNCVLNPISALSRLPYGGITAQPGTDRLMRDLMEECVAVAKASGITLPPDLWEIIDGVATQMPQQHSSTAQDLMRGKPTEIDFLNGEITRRGDALGIPTPVNHAHWVLTKLAEAAASAEDRAPSQP